MGNLGKGYLGSSGHHQGGVGLFVQFLAKKKKMKLQRKICVCWEWGDELSYSFNMFT